MNSKDVHDIYLRLRDKYPPNILEPKILSEIIQILLDHEIIQDEISVDN